MAAEPPATPTPQRRSKNLRRASSNNSFWLGHLPADLFLFDPHVFLSVQVLQDLLGVFGTDPTPVPECLATGRLPAVTCFTPEADCLLSVVVKEGAPVLPRKSSQVGKGLATSVAPNSVADFLFGEKELVSQLAKEQEDFFLVQFVQEFSVVGIRVVQTLDMEGNLGGPGLGEGYRTSLDV